MNYIFPGKTSSPAEELERKRCTQEAAGERGRLRGSAPALLGSPLPSGQGMLSGGQPPLYRTQAGTAWRSSWGLALVAAGALSLVT